MHTRHGGGTEVRAEARGEIEMVEPGVGPTPLAPPHSVECKTAGACKEVPEPAVFEPRKKCRVVERLIARCRQRRYTPVVAFVRKGQALSLVAEPENMPMQGR